MCAQTDVAWWWWTAQGPSNEDEDLQNKPIPFHLRQSLRRARRTSRRSIILASSSDQLVCADAQRDLGRGSKLGRHRVPRHTEHEKLLGLGRMAPVRRQERSTCMCVPSYLCSVATTRRVIQLVMETHVQAETRKSYHRKANIRNRHSQFEQTALLCRGEPLRNYTVSWPSGLGRLEDMSQDTLRGRQVRCAWHSLASLHG